MKDEDLKIKRNDKNEIDEVDAERLLKKVTENLITTERDVQKELSMRKAISDRRDIVVKVIIYQKNTQNNVVIREDYQNPLFEKLSDDPLDPFRYRYFDHLDGEISVKEMPMSTAKVGRWTMGCFKTVVNYLARMNVMNRV